MHPFRASITKKQRLAARFLWRGYCCVYFEADLECGDTGITSVATNFWITDGGVAARQ